jgi:predicted nucleic acid-binding protein
MTHLVDANVLSEPTKRTPDGKVIEWLVSHEGTLVVDSIVLGELYCGILALPQGRKRTRLEHWFEEVVQTIECLPWDAVISRRWAALVVEMQRRGQTVPLLGGMIAATALVHGLVVVTRNTRDFGKTGVQTLNPFE